MTSPTGKPLAKVSMNTPDSNYKGKKMKESADLILPAHVSNSLEGDKVDKYNAAIDAGEFYKEYTSEEVIPTNGMVIVQLYKKPVKKNGLYSRPQMLVPSEAGDRMKWVDDPLAFNNIGKVINMDPSIEEHVRFDIGDKVQINPRLAETGLSHFGPALPRQFQRSEEETFSGHILISSRDIELIINN